MKSKVLYYAVNGSGQGVVFTSYPIRDDKLKIWLGEIEGVYCSLVMQLESEEVISFPKDMKWSDSPKKIKLSLDICESDE